MARTKNKQGKPLKRKHRQRNEREISNKNVNG